MTNTNVSFALASVSSILSAIRALANAEIIITDTQVSYLECGEDSDKKVEGFIGVIYALNEIAEEVKFTDDVVIRIGVATSAHLFVTVHCHKGLFEIKSLNNRFDGNVDSVTKLVYIDNGYFTVRSGFYGMKKWEYRYRKQQIFNFCRSDLRDRGYKIYSPTYSYYGVRWNGDPNEYWELSESND